MHEWLNIDFELCSFLFNLLTCLWLKTLIMKDWPMQIPLIHGSFLDVNNKVINYILQGVFQNETKIIFQFGENTCDDWL